jgi:hypothetical protein
MDMVNLVVSALTAQLPADSVVEPITVVPSGPGGPANRQFLLSPDMWTIGRAHYARWFLVVTAFACSVVFAKSWIRSRRRPDPPASPPTGTTDQASGVSPDPTPPA